MIGIVLGLVLDTWIQEGSAPIVYAREPEPPKEVLIEVHINWTEERIKEEIAKVFPEDPDTAIKIAKCESGFDPKAYNKKTQDYGIFQLNIVHDPQIQALGLDVWDVEDNIKFARKLYDERGKEFTPWVCYTKHLI